MKITKDILSVQLQKKNIKALDFLVDTYSNLLYKVIYNVLISCGDKEAIEECLNDVFLSIWDNSDKFTGNPEKFVHWICVVAKYKAIDYQRKLSKNKEIIDINEYTAKCDFTPEDKLLASESKDEILNAINEMNETDRKIFTMRFFLNESINDIAQSLGVSRNVVDTRLSREKKQLKQKLNSFKKEVDSNEGYIQTL